jgi:hypothetical protein
MTTAPPFALRTRTGMSLTGRFARTFSGSPLASVRSPRGVPRYEEEIMTGRTRTLPDGRIARRPVPNACDITAPGGIPMNAFNDNTAARGLRGWWASPPRTGMQRLIVPYEYRHLRFFGATRIAGGILAAAAGAICLAYGVYGWAAFFLVLGALNLAGGSWYLTVARSASART